ncbi:MAG: arginine deiminase family protein, partial [Clostridium perfringens]|nr:arginine deiminase family protein [Clostridium perfringens]
MKVKRRKGRALNVTSEIGRLKTVLLHRPGEEIENLTPDLLDRLLFDDIPYLKVAREEHDAFAQTLREAGVEVLYLEVLAAEAIETSDEVKQQFISEFIDEAGVESERLKEALINVYPFVCDPMPNLYFTRDPFATIGHGITLNHMRTDTRNRETIFAKYIFRHHPRFEGKDIPFWFNRDDKTSLEGGDELILSKEILAVGISQRTDSKSVEKLAKKLLYYPDTSFKTVLAFKIPVSRAFMHLDTVFTQV